MNIYLIFVMLTITVLMLIINYVLAKYKPKYFKITMPITAGSFVYIFSIFDGMYHGINVQYLGISMSIVTFLITYFWVKGTMKVTEEKKNNKKK